MPDPSADEPASDAPAPRQQHQGTLSGFGIGSAALGVLAVVAVVLGVLIWQGHRADVAERTHKTDVLQAAIDWTGVLINMNKDTVAQSMQTLHDGTVGQLNADFESAVKPFSQVVQKLQSQTVGRVDSVAIESLHHAQPGDSGATPAPPEELTTVASRTDTVIVVATSLSQNAGSDKPLTVNWALRLGISDVDGKLLVSSLESIR